MLEVLDGGQRRSGMSVCDAVRGSVGEGVSVNVVD